MLFSCLKDETSCLHEDIFFVQRGPIWFGDLETSGSCEMLNWWQIVSRRALTN